MSQREKLTADNHASWQLLYQALEASRQEARAKAQAKQSVLDLTAEELKARAKTSPTTRST